MRYRVDLMWGYMYIQVQNGPAQSNLYHRHYLPDSVSRWPVPRLLLPKWSLCRQLPLPQQSLISSIRISPTLRNIPPASRAATATEHSVQLPSWWLLLILVSLNISQKTSCISYSTGFPVSSATATRIQKKNFSKNVIVPANVSEPSLCPRTPCFSPVHTGVPCSFYTTVPFLEPFLTRLSMHRGILLFPHSVSRLSLPRSSYTPVTRE